jgi:probable O-glycosylation ligase (exosortase A-associated)
VAVLVLLIPAALFSPFIGLLGWTWISYFSPHQFTWGFTRVLPVGLLIVVPTLLGLPFTRQHRLPPLTSETLLLLLLWFWFLVTTTNVHFSPVFVHHWADTEHKLLTVSKILLMVFVSLMLVIDSRRLRMWYWVTAGIFAFFALKSAVFGVLTGGQYKVFGPPDSMIADNNDFGLAMNIALPMFVCLARTETSQRLRWAFRVAIPMGIIAVVLTYSRGAMLGLAVLLLLWAAKSRYKVLGVAGLLVTLLAVFAYAPQAWMKRMETLRTAPQTDASAQSRLRSWKFAIELARDHPLFGGGFETFTLPLYAQYGIDDTHGPHSIYFQMLADHGVPGLLLFLTLIASCWWSCRLLIRRFRGHESLNYLAEYARMLQLSLAGFLVSGAFLGRAYFDLFYQLVATVIILKSLARRELADLERLAPAEEAHELAAAAQPAS